MIFRRKESIQICNSQLRLEFSNLYCKSFKKYNSIYLYYSIFLVNWKLLRMITPSTKISLTFICYHKIFIQPLAVIIVSIIRLCERFLGRLGTTITTPKIKKKEKKKFRLCLYRGIVCYHFQFRLWGLEFLTLFCKSFKKFNSSQWINWRKPIKK